MNKTNGAGDKTPSLLQPLVKKIFLAVPVGSGTITYDCAESILRNTHILRDNGIEVVPYFKPSHIYVDRERNLCIKAFLESDCNEMVFIDSDVSFEDNSLLKLLKHDKDIVGGVYPFRKDNEDDYPVVIRFNEQNNCKEEETGLVYADMIPTGFMRIQRRVFDRILEDSSDKSYSVVKDHEGVYTFFRTGILFPDDNTWYGEDVAFCKKWRMMGGELFVEPRITFYHTGMKQFKGNYHEHLMGRTIRICIDALDKQNDGLDGWMEKDELEQLKLLAEDSDSIVEIGSWKGRSTKILLEACEGNVYAVDHWNGSLADLSTLTAAGRDIYKDFIHNVGHYPNLIVLRGDSIEMATQFNGNKVDMVFIDAEHTYEGCKADIDAWLPKCKKYICGHDYNLDFPGVVQAVNEKFGKPEICNSIWWVKL